MYRISSLEIACGHQAYNIQENHCPSWATYPLAQGKPESPIQSTSVPVIAIGRSFGKVTRLGELMSDRSPEIRSLTLDFNQFQNSNDVPLATGKDKKGWGEFGYYGL